MCTYVRRRRLAERRCRFPLIVLDRFDRQYPFSILIFLSSSLILVYKSFRYQIISALNFLFILFVLEKNIDLGSLVLPGRLQRDILSPLPFIHKIQSKLFSLMPNPLPCCTCYVRKCRYLNHLARFREIRADVQHHHPDVFGASGVAMNKTRLFVLGYATGGAGGKGRGT